MKKLLQTILAVGMLAGFAGRLEAQITISGTGCVDSPEAPTDVLMIVGAAGAYYGASVIAKLRRK